MTLVTMPAILVPALFFRAAGHRPIGKEANLRILEVWVFASLLPYVSFYSL